MNLQRFNKATVAVVMAILGLLNVTGWLPQDFVTEETVSAIVSVLTPVLVYVIPNAPANKAT